MSGEGEQMVDDQPPVKVRPGASIYIPADIYSKYLRLKGEDVVFVCGSDEHGVPITIKARQEGVKPQQIVDEFHRMNKEIKTDHTNLLFCWLPPKKGR